MILLASLHQTFTKPLRYQGPNSNGQVSPFLLRSLAFQEMFKSVDILCVPATMDAAFDAEVRYPTKQIDQSFSNYLGWMMPAATVSVLLDQQLWWCCGC